MLGQIVHRRWREAFQLSKMLLLLLRLRKKIIWPILSKKLLEYVHSDYLYCCRDCCRVCSRNM
jgi:hypothetical protein